MLERLADLVGPPTPRAFTLTFAGRERHEGQAPTRFVVNAANLDDAAPASPAAAASACRSS
ncbi:hypothetical protein L0F81_05780, partial [Streptomyces tricolor]